MARRQRNSRLFNQFLLSHVLIFAVPFIVLSCVVYYNAVVSFRSEIETANLYKLNQLKHTLDLMASGLDKTAARMSIDPLLTPFTARNDVYGEIEAVEELSKYKENNAAIHELALYFHGDDLIYSSSGMSSLDTFLTGIYRFSDVDKETLAQQLNEHNAPQIRRAQTVASEGERSENTLLYSFPIPRNSPSPYATVVFLLQESVLKDFVNPILGDFMGSVYISDADGNVIASRTKGMDLGTSDFDRMLPRNDKDGVYGLAIGNERYSLMQTKSDLTGWSYVVMMPSSQFLGRMLEMRTFVLIVCASVVAIGIIIAILLSRRHYRPIRRLADHIRSMHGPKEAVQGRSNEWDVIQRSVESTRELMETIDSQRPIVREQLLSKLLKGLSKETGELEAVLAGDHLAWRGSRYFVAVVSTGAGDYISTKHREELLRALSVVDLPESVGYGVEMMMDQTIVVLMNTGCDEQELRRIREEAVIAIVDRFERSCGIRPSIGLGTSAEELSQVNRSYIEASAALEVSVQRSPGAICYFEDISDWQDRNEWYSAKEQLRLVQSMKQGNKEAAKTALEAILNELRVKEVSVFLFRCMCFDLINTCLRTMNELKLTLVQDQRSILTEFATLEQLRSGMLGLIGAICEHVEAGKTSKHHALGEQILSYIQNHYTEYDLNLERLADHFQMSLSYFSRFMKDQTGYTFTDYVAGLRMEEVKRQLKHTEQPIKEIVFGVGYADVSNFMRKFKNAEGITPGQYRKLHS